MSANDESSGAPKLAIGVLASGTGSNFEAIAAAIAEQRLDAEIRVLVCNRPNAGVLAKAKARRVPSRLIEHGDYHSRESFDAAIVSVLRRAGVELVAMAGFDRLISPLLLEAFVNRVINIHPALLPAFKGLGAQAQAAEYGSKITGATVHLVDAETDHGPIIVQAAVAIGIDDDTASVQKRILAEEHRIYPYAIQLFAHDRIEVVGRRVRIRGIGEHASGALYSPALPHEFLGD